MTCSKSNCSFLRVYLIIIMSCVALQCNNANANQTSTLVVDASDGSGRPIPKTLFGIFFEVRDYYHQSLYSKHILYCF
jgi:alpha-N-arabinofuranosidase